MNHYPDSYSKNWSHKGFTLIELLLTVAILALIVGILGGAFRLVARSWEKGEAEVEEFRKTRIGLDKIAQQLKSTYPYWVKKEEKWMIAFEGGAKSLKFVSPLSLQSPLITGFLWVQYTLADESTYDQGKKLLVRETRVIDKDSFQESDAWSNSSGTEMELLSGMEDLGFEYYMIIKDSQDKNSEEGEWLTSWIWEEKEEEAKQKEEKLMLPQAIRITLKQKPKNPEQKELLVTAMTIPLIALPDNEVTMAKGGPAISPGGGSIGTPFDSFTRSSQPPSPPGEGQNFTPFGPLPGPPSRSGTPGSGGVIQTPFGPVQVPPGGK